MWCIVDKETNSVATGDINDVEGVAFIFLKKATAMRLLSMFPEDQIEQYEIKETKEVAVET